MNSSLESRIQNVLMSMIQKRIIPLLLKGFLKQYVSALARRNTETIFFTDPLVLVDQELVEFYDKIAKQFYPAINPRNDEEPDETKLLPTVVDVKLLEEVSLYYL